MPKNTHHLIPNISKPFKLDRKSNIHNIKVNKIHLKKEKIIEGELNFEDNNKKRYYLVNNQKQRSGLNNNKQQKRRIPNRAFMRPKWRRKAFSLNWIVGRFLVGCKEMAGYTSRHGRSFSA